MKTRKKRITWADSDEIKPLKIKTVHLKRESKIGHWTVADDKKLLEISTKYKFGEIAVLLNRTVTATKARLQLLNQQKSAYKNRWSYAEDYFLKKFYPKKNIKWLSQKLARSIWSVKCRITTLKLAKKNE